MIWIFWLALASILYAYFGFPALLWLRAALFARPFDADDETPSVSVVIAAYNEAAHIGRRLDNLLAQDYPADRLEIVIASDGSSDATNDIVKRYAAENEGRVRIMLLAEPRQGKGLTLNAGAAAAAGEILIFSDANSHYEPHSIRRLVRPFADRRVGGVAGNQVYLRDTSGGSTADGERLYWNFDQWMKSLQSRAGSVTSATGAIYAVRRSLYQAVPSDAMDDFYVSTGVVAQGYRLVYAPDARALEPAAEAEGVEYSRKLRIITQGLQAVIYRRALLNPLRYGWYAWQLFSHKVVRRIVGLPMLIAAVTCPLLWNDGLVYRVMLILELTVFALLCAAWLLRRTRVGAWKPLAVARYFVMVNTAALVSLGAILRGRRVRRWEPERHQAESAAGPAWEHSEGQTT